MQKYTNYTYLIELHEFELLRTQFVKFVRLFSFVKFVSNYHLCA